MHKKICGLAESLMVGLARGLGPKDFGHVSNNLYPSKMWQKYFFQQFIL